jgi:hypothetical protein
MEEDAGARSDPAATCRAKGFVEPRIVTKVTRRRGGLNEIRYDGDGSLIVMCKGILEMLHART